MKVKPNECIGIYKDGKFVKRVNNALEARDYIGIEDNIFDLVYSGNASEKGFTFDLLEKDEKENN